MDSPTLSARAAAALLHMDDRSLRRAIARHELSGTKVGGAKNSPLRIDRAAVEAYADAHGIALVDDQLAPVTEGPLANHPDFEFVQRAVAERPRAIGAIGAGGKVSIGIDELLQLQERAVRAEDRWDRVTGQLVAIADADLSAETFRTVAMGLLGIRRIPSQLSPSAFPSERAHQP